MNNFARLLSLLFIVGLYGCSSDGDSSVDEPYIDPEILYQERLAKKERIRQSVHAASDEQIVQLLSDCVREIKYTVKLRNKNTFENYLVTFQSEERIQHMFPEFAIDSDHKRILDLRNSENNSLNTVYGYMVVKDSFSGLTYNANLYECHLGEGPAIERVTQKYGLL